MGGDDTAKWVVTGVATVCAIGVAMAIMTSTPIDVAYKSFRVGIGKATAGPSNDSPKSKSKKNY